MKPGKQKPVNRQREVREKGERDGEPDIEREMKRRAWEDTGRGEALPARPSGLDEEDRKRMRTADEEQEDRTGDNKKIWVSEDIDMMNDEEWTEYVDEIRSRRNIMLVIPDVNKRATGKYENRACLMAEVQNSLGSYYIM